MKFDVVKIRREFPILSRKINGFSLAYLDNASTTQKPERVLKALDRYYRFHNANIHRGLHTLSEEATKLYEDARKTVAAFINAEPEEVIFTRNTTESINLVAATWGRGNIKRGDVILLSDMEHHSNLLPWQQLARQNFPQKNLGGLAKIRFIPLTKNGELDLSNLPKLLKGVKLLALVHVSNVLGTINPVEKVIQAAHKAGAKVLIDAAQSVPHMEVDVKKMDCDFLAFSGHKLYGPTGIGALYGKRELLEKMPPFLYGGDMVKAVRKDSAIWHDLPWKFEAGTSNIADAIALAEAVKFLEDIGMGNIRSFEAGLTRYAMKKLSYIRGLTIYGPQDCRRRGAVISFTIRGIHPHDLATILDRQGVAIRSGHHCAMPLHIQLGVAATARASFAFYNTTAEIDRLVDGIRYAQKLFNR